MHTSTQTQRYPQHDRSSEARLGLQTSDLPVELHYLSMINGRLKKSKKARHRKVPDVVSLSRAPMF